MIVIFINLISIFWLFEFHQWYWIVFELKCSTFWCHLQCLLNKRKVGRCMNINLCDSIIWCLIIRADQTCWWPNPTSQASLSVCPVLIGQFLESWSLIGGITINVQTSTSLSGESSGLTLMVAVSPVLDWPRVSLSHWS